MIYLSLAGLKSVCDEYRRLRIIFIDTRDKLDHISRKLHNCVSNDEIGRSIYKINEGIAEHLIDLEKMIQVLEQAVDIYSDCEMELYDAIENDEINMSGSLFKEGNIDVTNIRKLLKSANIIN